MYISIHTTTQVVTYMRDAVDKVVRISIHTTTQVVTHGVGTSSSIPTNFNPHHHAGGDNEGFALNGIENDFNPHHHAGGDKTWTRFKVKVKISIHTTTQVVTQNVMQQELVRVFQSTPPRRW